MKQLNRTLAASVVGGATVVGGVTTRDPADFDWLEFGLTTGLLAAVGALVGAVVGAGGVATQGSVLAGMAGGAVLAGGLAAAGDTAHQLAPNIYHKTF